MGETHKILGMVVTTGERDFPEDFHHENGCYQNRCIDCKQLFLGYKRRLVCKVCEAANLNTQKVMNDAIDARMDKSLDRLEEIIEKAESKIEQVMMGEADKLAQLAGSWFDRKDLSLKEREDAVAANIIKFYSDQTRQLRERLKITAVALREVLDAVEYANRHAKGTYGFTKYPEACGKILGIVDEAIKKLEN